VATHSYDYEDHPPAHDRLIHNFHGPTLNPHTPTAGLSHVLGGVEARQSQPTGPNKKMEQQEVVGEEEEEEGNGDGDRQGPHARVVGGGEEDPVEVLARLHQVRGMDGGWLTV
jgi:hypothetical protein